MDNETQIQQVTTAPPTPLKGQWISPKHSSGHRSRGEEESSYTAVWQHRGGHWISC